jgi:hypothetical protein
MSSQHSVPTDTDLDLDEELEMRALFERRAPMIRPPVDLEARVHSAVKSTADQKASRRAALASTMRVGFGLAACVTALVGTHWLDTGWLDPGSSSGLGQSRSLPLSNAVTSSASYSSDEPLACAFPVSGFVSSADQRAACVSVARSEPTSVRAPVCEELVTSSIAGP